MSTPARKVARPCQLEVVITATDERGVAYCQWLDGEYAVKLDSSGSWVDVDPSGLVFVGQATEAA